MAWRVLDAQYTITEEYPRAVPQRRRRIWLVGYKGNDWRIPSRIVFETNKALGDTPPKRIPGIGFKTINEDVDVEALRAANKDPETVVDDGCLDLFSSMQDDTQKSKKVSQMIPLDDFPNDGDFSKARMVDIYEFAKKVGEPNYLGDVFRKDRKTASAAFKQMPEYKEDYEWQQSEEAHALFAKCKAAEEAGELHWEGAELIAPQILENIGNAGILANGRILTMNCHEWTAGIQLSPKTFNAWEEIAKHKDWLKANSILPDAYDETVCGLSDILEEDPDEKYNLSWRACFGILRRAETRGKELPPALYIALISTIRENAGIVKWFVFNGKDTKKKDTDLTERESAKLCFDKFCSPVMKFDEVVAEPPKRKLGESDIGFDDEDEEQAYEDSQEAEEDGDSEGTYWEGKADKWRAERAEMPDLPNGCVNESGGETAPTIVASQYKGPGNTQDATVVALKKEVKASKE